MQALRLGAQGVELLSTSRITLLVPEPRATTYVPSVAVRCRSYLSYRPALEGFDDKRP